MRLLDLDVMCLAIEAGRVMQYAFGQVTLIDDGFRGRIVCRVMLGRSLDGANFLSFLATKP